MTPAFTAVDREGAATLFEAVARYRAQYPEVSFWMAFGHVPRPSESAGTLATMAVHTLLPGATLADDQTLYLFRLSAALREGWTPDPAIHAWTPPSEGSA